MPAYLEFPEHLTRLAELPQAGFKFFAVPVKVCAFGLRGA
jgi:hypothetical protein